MDCEPRVWRKERNQTTTSFNTELVLVWIGASCGLDRVWIGLDPGLDRPRSGPTCLCMLQLGCSLTRKDGKVRRQQVYSLAAWQAGLIQLTTVSAWQFDSLDAQQLQLGCWTAGLLSSVALRQSAAWKLDSLAAWLYNSLLLGCLAGWITAEQETQKHATISGPDINSPINSIIPKVWIKGLDRILSKGLDQRSGSEVWIVCGTGAWSRPYILSRSHIYMTCKMIDSDRSTLLEFTHLFVQFFLYHSGSAYGPGALQFRR